MLLCKVKVRSLFAFCDFVLCLTSFVAFLFTILEVFYVKDEKTNEILQGSEKPQTVFHQVRITIAFVFGISLIGLAFSIGWIV